VGDMNFTLVLYRVDRQRTNNDDVYGEALEDGIQFLAPVEFKGYVQIEHRQMLIMVHLNFTNRTR
jgi:hypothetical protein